MSIVFSSSLDRLTEYNSSFDKGVLRVCYVGQNRNNSFISKATFERCMQSIYNCPIVCRYDRETDEIGEHDVDIVKNGEGQVYFVNATHPIGMIPESANYWFEEVEEVDGTINEYLFIDALLWKRQEAYKKIKEDGITDESMEISVKEGSMQDGRYVIERFEFTAFCLLGTAEPCYESASLMVFSQEDSKAQFDEMMKDFKESLSTIQSSHEVDIHAQFNLEGGKEALEEKKTLMAQYGLTEEMLDFSLEDFSEGELAEKFAAIAEAEKNKSFALAGQLREELFDALSAEKVETCFGETSRYWYNDHDSETTEVYCFDHADWKLYGFTYSMNGDHVNIDFDSKKRKKFSIVDFDEGEQTVAFAAVYAQASEQYEAADKEWAEKYATLEAEVEQLRKFKSEAEQSADVQAKEEVFSRFEDLAGVEAFDNLRGDCEQYSLEDLEEKCFAIRGRNQALKFSVNETKPPKLMVEKTATGEDEPYGGVFSEFGITRTK